MGQDRVLGPAAADLSSHHRTAGGLWGENALDATVNGIIAILSASFAVYLSEPLSVFPILGTPGLYLICISGNSKQIRVPAALMAQDGAGVEQGTPEGGIMSSIGVATSMFISILVMTVMIFMGKWILGALPDPVVAALPMLLPALFGALLAQQLMNHPGWGQLPSRLLPRCVWPRPGEYLEFCPLAADMRRC